MGKPRGVMPPQPDMPLDGVIRRDAESGLLISVETAKGLFPLREKTKIVIEEVSKRRADALKRLKDR